MKKIIIKQIIPRNIDKRRFLIIILSDTTNKILKKDFCLFSRISFFYNFSVFKFKKNSILDNKQSQSSLLIITFAYFREIKFNK